MKSLWRTCRTIAAWGLATLCAIVGTQCARITEMSGQPASRKTGTGSAQAASGGACPLFFAPLADFFVSVKGDDRDPGTARRPFASLARARDAVRERIARGLASDVTVLIRGGVYRITEPVVFGPEDSGTAQFRVTYAAYPGERPVISGGRLIEGWKRNGDGTWSAAIPDVPDGKRAFRELFINGRRATRARHPNTGYLRVEKAGEDNRTHFQYRTGDLRAYRDLEAVELVFLHDWSVTRTPVKAIDEAARVLTVPVQIGGASSWAGISNFEPHPRYFLENSIEFLDAPGEWYLDRKTGVLTYRPRPGETLRNLRVEAPVAPQLLVVRGDAEAGRPVRNLRFAGLAFECAAWLPPDGTVWEGQACSYGSPATERLGKNRMECDPAAVQFDAAENCRLENGAVRHVGRSGIWFGSRCRNNTLAATTVSDVGGNGVMIGEGQTRIARNGKWWETVPEQAASGNEVRDCLVERCGQELFGAVGVWVGLTEKTRITGNEVRDLPYTGISVGWMWWDPAQTPEPQQAPCRENVIEGNDIHHVMLTLSDGGGIYALGNQPGSALRANRIHDIPPNAGRADSNGMFMDQGAGGFLIEDNLIYGVGRSPIRFHKGWANVIRNNRFQIPPGAQMITYSPDTRKDLIQASDNTVIASDADLRRAIREMEKSRKQLPE